MDERSAAEQIDGIIKNAGDWRGEMLAALRPIVMRADPAITEAVKWKKPSKPEGVAVWECNGNICMADILKNAVRLTFPKGAHIADPTKLFNTRLDSKSVRAIDFFKDDSIDDKTLTAIVTEAVMINQKS